MERLFRSIFRYKMNVTSSSRQLHWCLSVCVGPSNWKGCVRLHSAPFPSFSNFSFFWFLTSQVRRPTDSWEPRVPHGTPEKLVAFLFIHKTSTASPSSANSPSAIYPSDGRNRRRTRRDSRGPSSFFTRHTDSEKKKNGWKVGKHFLPVGQ